MATQLLLKKSNQSSRVPTDADLEYGELAINYRDGILYYKRYDGVVDVIAQKQQGGGSGIVVLEKTTNYTMSDGDFIFANTENGTFTVTLPAAPVIGSFAVIYMSDQNPLTVDGNGRNIEGSPDDLVFNVSNMKAEFIFDGTNWQVYAPIDQQYVQSVIEGQITSDIIKYAIALG